jgi:hypothetical protein
MAYENLGLYIPTIGALYVLNGNIVVPGIVSPGTPILSFQGKAGVRYIIDGYFRVSNSPAGGGFKLGLSGPALSECFISGSGIGNSATQYATSGVVAINTFSALTYGTLVSSGNGVLFRGFIIPASNGLVTLNIAAVTNPVTVLGNASWMKICEG